ncbi:Oxoglutarate/iron-dependent dioxygenase [uncultured Caudovirales phage]|uniref:Oxoglutarate/iron-dependent dioxygenase n=1 Tax=uncultured Caudovirales phage TaxID=2100421 RepID=A0A6J5KVI5_9CAUD|nr:Oxoglutarate/iron-dependent dioxygenase [uncultured Caudovirales phage]CAB5208836.1 Oxoglutarate/iron-dependent dioxygenase [uncultured Caudovirales phage]
MNVQIIENLIPKSLADKIEQAFLHDDTEWNLAAGCGGYREMQVKDAHNIKDTPQMYHSLVSDNKPKTQLTSLAMCVLFFLEDKTGIFPQYISRVKANLLFPLFDNPTQLHPPHIDTENPKSLTLVYYVLDSDGPTRLFDSDGNVTHTIEPKKGTGVLFPSTLIHSSSCPIHNQKRIVINYVFEPKQLD